MINSAMHKNNASACAVITVDNLHQITNNEQNCNLSVYLDKHLDFEVSIGYGIGLNLDMAIKNSHTARREALLSGKRPGCLRESERTAKSRYAGSVRSRCIRSTGRPV